MVGLLWSVVGVTQGDAPAGGARSNSEGAGATIWEMASPFHDRYDLMERDDQLLGHVVNVPKRDLVLIRALDEAIGAIDRGR